MVVRKARSRCSLDIYPDRPVQRMTDEGGGFGTCGGDGWHWESQELGEQTSGEAVSLAALPGLFPVPWLLAYGLMARTVYWLCMAAADRKLGMQAVVFWE